MLELSALSCHVGELRKCMFIEHKNIILSSTKFNKVVIIWATGVAITLNMGAYSQADVVELLKV